MTTKSKFLVLNPSTENLGRIIEKANLQESKVGPFEAILLLGDVQPKESEIPKTTFIKPAYFTEGLHEVNEEISSKRDDGNFNEIRKNLNYVKKPFALLEMPSGIKIAFVLPVQNEQEIILHINNDFPKSEVDILLTYQWPYAISKREKLLSVADRQLDAIVKLLRPRYHFAVGTEEGSFYELQPFQWDQGSERICRFISLVKEGTGGRWFYAFEILKENTIQPDIKLLDSPYETEKVSPNNPKLQSNTDLAEEPPAKRKKMVAPSDCFFCLSNPDVEAHMIVSIGTYAYLTIAKGPVTKPSNGLRFSGHAIIVPIKHMPTLKSDNEDYFNSPIYQEITKFKISLVDAFSNVLSHIKVISFEINREENVHYHVQLVPINENLIEEFPRALHERVEVNNEQYDQNNKLEFIRYEDEEDPELTLKIRNSDNMVFTIYHGKDKKEIFISELNDSNKSVDLQFPRRVLASLLKSMKRMNWVRCKQPKYKEIQECEHFRQLYKRYDFTQT